jgi:beta-1,3-galactosyl-O-glycosyl-glycoprotein beta-1,6-N-acetylglucosaminyltransferase/N-acetyllactosaminide beta-1,6-N-acetylglucosaminyltransferase
LILYQAIVNRSKCVTNIYLPEKRLNVTWGQFSVLEAEHLCQKELLKRSKQWKYYFNLANTDIPLKTNTELVQILKLYNHQNDITSLPYHSQLQQNKALFNHTLPSSISLPFYKGEFHVLLTREAVEYIHTNSRVADLYNYLNGTSVPDEHFYSMINRWKETPGFYPYDHDLSQTSFMTRYKIWNDRPESRLCRGGFVRTICVFNYQDLWHLATSPHLFANKIFFQQDRLTPYCMAQYLDIRDNMKQKQKDFSMIDEEFYKQLKNVQYGKEKLLK